MKFYRVKDEFINEWLAPGETADNLVVSADEVKRLSAEWGIPVAELFRQCDPVAKTVKKVERYQVGDYIMECEEESDPSVEYSTVYHFWLYRNGYGVKELMFGFPIDQRTAKIDAKVYTKDECLEIAFANIGEYIESYAEEYEDA